MSAYSPEVRPAQQSSTWADTDADIDTQSYAGSVTAGWPISTNPPGRKRLNWVLNWVMRGVRYLLHQGVPMWASGETYAVGDIVKLQADPADVDLWQCYSALTSTTVPSSDPTHWSLYTRRRAVVDNMVTIGTCGAGVTTTAGSIASKMFCNHIDPLNGTVLKRKLIHLSSVPSGGCTVVFSGSDAFATSLFVQATKTSGAEGDASWVVASIPINNNVAVYFGGSVSGSPDVYLEVVGI
jgi:hypothetical protein